MFKPLREHLDVLNPAKPDDLLFLGVRGGAFAPATVQKRAPAAWEAAGVEQFTFPRVAATVRHPCYRIAGESAAPFRSG